MQRDDFASQLKIRRAEGSDAAGLATLAGELGYPTAVNKMKVRLRRILPKADNVVFVAELEGLVIGWLHLSVCEQVETPTFGEINGLIVAEGHRSAG
jgi:N-acetylglutamate synthase-like GNAT family acetyltransferase